MRESRVGREKGILYESVSRGHLEKDVYSVLTCTVQNVIIYASAYPVGSGVRSMRFRTHFVHPSSDCYSIPQCLCVLQ